METQSEPQIVEDDLYLGSVISRSFSVFKEKFFLFLILGLIAVVPVSAVEIFIESESFFSNFLNMVLGGLVGAAIAYAVYQILLERDVTLGEALTNGLSRLGPLMLASILMSLGVFLGFLLLVVPGIILTCMWLVTIPACVVEDLSAADSISRSAELTKGYRMKIFLALLMIGVVLFIAAFAFGLIIWMGLFESGRMPVAMTVARMLLVLAGTVFYDILVAVIYYDLRAIKEGMSLDSLAEIFD